MTPDVRLGSGVVVDLPGGPRVACDGGAAADVTVLSHAHGDHAVTGADPLVCSPLTADLVATRRGTSVTSTAGHEHLELFPAGHVAGSRAVRITDPDTGRRYLYTGDVSTRDRWYLDGFEPVDADVLVVETTYGTPDYRLPPTEDVQAAASDWLAETADRVVLLFGYALGRAQKLQRMAASAGRDRVLATEVVREINAVVEDHLSVSYGAEPYRGPDDLQPGDAVVLPGSPRTSAVIEALEEAGVAHATAGFSGWAVDSSFRFRGGYDETFALSDHCGFDDLVDLVRAVDPERVYTQHGAADEFARHLTVEYGYETRALRRDQATLADF